MNASTSTRNPFWEEECRKLAEKGEPFQVRNVETNSHRIFCSGIAFRYKYTQQFLDETTLLLTPTAGTMHKPKGRNGASAAPEDEGFQLHGRAIRPATGKRAYQVYNVTGRDGFKQKCLRAQRIGLVDHFQGVVGGNGNFQQVAHWGDSLAALEHCESVFSGKPDVEQQNTGKRKAGAIVISPVAAQVSNGVVAIANHVDGIGHAGPGQN